MTQPDSSADHTPSDENSQPQPGGGLPRQPDLAQLKRQAKELYRDRFAEGDAGAQARAFFAKHHPRDPQPDQFKLSDAQLVLARKHGFASWPQLKRYVEHVSMTPDEKVSAFVNAALFGSLDRANEFLEDNPEIANADLRTWLVLGNLEQVHQAIADDPAAATRKLGAHNNVPPIVYACFSKYLRARDERADRIIECARILLDAGESPNAGYCSDPEQPEKITPILYGATGVNNHPKLARILLLAGADPDDGESAYHAAEHCYVESLKLLEVFEADFSKRHAPWNNTILYFLLGYPEGDGGATDADRGIRWLLEHGADPRLTSYDSLSTPLHLIAKARRGELVDWMIEFGADVNAQDADGHTPLYYAIVRGNADAERALKEHGAQADLTPTDLFMAACSRGDDEAVQQALRENPQIVRELPPHYRQALPDACWQGSEVTAKTMLKAGFDVSVRGDMGGTPLHLAAWHGRSELVREILKYQPPLDWVCETFGTPPLGWATHGSANCHRKNGDWLGCAEAIIKAGAPLDGPLNKWDERPIDLGTDELAALLIRYGAKA